MSFSGLGNSFWSRTNSARNSREQERGEQTQSGKKKKNKYPIPFFVLIPQGNGEGGGHTHAKRRQESPGLSVLLFIRGEAGALQPQRNPFSEQIQARGPLRNPRARRGCGTESAQLRLPCPEGSPSPCPGTGTSRAASPASIPVGIASIPVGIP